MLCLQFDWILYPELNEYYVPRKNAAGTTRIFDLCLIAVRNDYQGKGVNSILMRDMRKVFIRHSIGYAESNPELEENKSAITMGAP